MRYFFSFVVLLSLTSCMKDKPALNPGTVTAMDSEALGKLQKSLCAEDEVLKEDDVRNKGRVYNELSTYKVFGFLIQTSECALVRDFNKDGAVDEWFSLTLFDDCLRNGSLWTIKESTRADNRTRVQFVEYGQSGDEPIRLYAGYDVMLKNLSSALGMKFYNCIKAEFKN